MKAELLAPVSNMESLYAAISAGADAVYAGTDRYSARAGADNMTVSELCSGIRTAHIHGVKVYLTLNTLLYDEELEDAVKMIRPLYESGLDGIIIQDLGLSGAVRDIYPDLPCHASTQMGIMNSYGALQLKSMGFSRIVPARELSLDEIRTLKREADIELECFIHGAMCYSYSGYCLMSSFLGGRSGNRGRCAGACRLPFSVPAYPDRGFGDDPQYPLSMKDLCGINLIGELICAGVDSFKIEGRMKAPEYVAGVTSIYRKYIDKYLESPDSFKIDKKDLTTLKKLYIRKELCTGYFNISSENKNDLITFDKPGYNGSDEGLLSDIRDRYITHRPRLKTDIQAYLHAGAPVEITLKCEGAAVHLKGRTVDTALKHPLQEEDIKSKLGALGNTEFELGDFGVDMTEDVFTDAGELKRIRRAGIESLENSLIKDIHGLAYERHIQEHENINVAPVQTAYNKRTADKPFRTDAEVFTLQQLRALNGYEAHFDRVILNYRLYLGAKDECLSLVRDMGNKAYLSLPLICRSPYDSLFDRLMRDVAATDVFSGVMVHSFDALCMAKERIGDMPVITDIYIYAQNSNSIRLLQGFTNIDTIVLPYEMGLRNIRELYACSSKENAPDICVTTYGSIPMMISEGCIKKTYGRCDKKPYDFDPVMLRDRLGKNFPVITDCLQCNNVILNTIPLNLRKWKKEISESSDRQLIRFTTEDEQSAERVLRSFMLDEDAASVELDAMPHTTGHIKKGVL